MKLAASRTHLAVAALTAALLATPAVAQKDEQPVDNKQDGPSVHFLLQPLLERPSEEIPAILRDDFGGRQGRHTIDRRPALSLILQTDASAEELKQLGAVVRATGDGWASINLLPERLPELVEARNIYAISIPRKFERILETSVAGTG
ncbi:MAG: hypothetical protein AAGE94_07240, partial [Acidobacteriota bacterium]